MNCRRLFLLFIIDIVTDIGPNIILFADDTNLLVIVEDPETTAEIFNLDLEQIRTWAKTWLVSLNPKKTEILLIFCKLNKPVHQPFLMINQVIIELDSPKHVGVFLSNDCTWHRHIDYVKEKAWFIINVMRSLKFCLDRKSLETIGRTFIRPILEYADVVLGNCTNYEKQELDKIQTEAARIVAGATKLVSLHIRFDEVNLEPLETRHMKHRLLLLHFN